jgi:ParB family chromosome partitioning protein
MVRKTGLGRGLDALIPPDEETPPEASVLEIPIQHIHPNPRQPRKTIEPNGLSDLADSIREHGILQPLLVSAENGGQYTLIAGERRLRAAQMAGLASVPALVRQASDQNRLELALIENLQRMNLNPLEAAQGYQQLAEEFHLTQEEIAKKVGKSRVAVTNTLRLLMLAPDCRQALVDGRITEGHARALLGLNSSAAQHALLETVLRLDLNVRQTEELVRKFGGEREKNPVKSAPAPEIQSLEDALRTRLGTKVTLHHGKKGGTLTIHYYSEEELEILVNHLLHN